MAVIAEITSTGKVPDNQVEYGKQIVKERFATSNVYFAIDNLVSGAVRQINGGIDKIGNMLDFIPGLDSVAGIAKFFVNISLGYVNECCLGYSFLKKDEGVFKSSADGVVIYAQNWKKLLKDAAKTMLTVVIALSAVTLVCFIVLGLLFRLLHWSGLVAFALSVFIAMAIKFSFIDSFVMVKMMSSYMEVVPTTKISYDLYQDLCKLSQKFTELFKKVQEEQPLAETGVESYNQPIV